MYQYPGASRSVRLILSAVSLIAIGIYLIWSKYYAPSFAQSFLNDAALEVFHGKVDSIYDDVPNHDERIALLSDGYKFSLWLDWESKISVGDSLSKNGNSLTIELHKRDGRVINLNYKEVAKGFRKDLQ